VKIPKDWSVYLVRCADKSLYTGIAKDVAARVSAHNKGKGAAYTRSRKPVKLVYRRDRLTRSAALVEEARIKALERTEKLAFLKKAARTAGRAAAALALLWSLAAPARAIPSFDKENGISLSSAVPLAFTGENAVAAGAYTNLRMYYLPAISSGAPHASSGTAILSATSVDGVTWVREAGVRVDTNTVPSVSASSITGAAIQPLTGGGFRMLYSIVSTTGSFRIHSATSADGLAWANETDEAVNGGTAYVGVPRLVVLNSGDWRLYYTRDFNGGDDLADRRIFTARSTDQGATWGASSIVVSTTAYESGAAKLTDGRVRLFYSQPPSAGSSATVVLSSLSSDALGASFTAEAGVRLSTPVVTGALAFPVPVRSTDSFRWRLYYAYYEAFSSTGDVRSALTGSPAPASVTPSTIYRSGPSGALTISGEVFSAAPTVSITKGAVTIAGTGVTRTDDQSITATFATQNQALGYWDVKVTNADGVPGTASGALLIDYAPGTVALTDNLLRPRLGGSTLIDVLTFNDGHVSVRVYDSEGRPIRTLFDDEHAAGSFGFSWDGRNASGAVVPSGLYFVAVNGPKIAVKSKIVVIR
jgi:predicted GIY-YIG superfamily endonuclease